MNMKQLGSVIVSLGVSFTAYADPVMESSQLPTPAFAQNNSSEPISQPEKIEIKPDVSGVGANGQVQGATVDQNGRWHAVLPPGSVSTSQAGCLASTRCPHRRQLF